MQKEWLGEENEMCLRIKTQRKQTNWKGQNKIKDMRRGKCWQENKKERHYKQIYDWKHLIP
jgi:hypothetical protein